MMFIKEESIDFRIEEVFSLKHEDTEELTAVCRNPSKLVHCLICHKPQTKIEHHLSNMCLRDAEDGCIQQEVSRAKESQEMWTREGRIMNISEVKKLVREDPSCDSLAEYFRSKGFLIKEERDSAAIQESEILALAEEDMGEVSNRLSQHKGVPAKTKTVFRSFCLATMMWVHHLGPASIKEFKVQEWNDRATEGDGVVVKLSKGSIKLNKKEEHWLDCYFKHIRPEYLKAQPPKGDDRDRFFLGASGLPLCNPTADVHRLREKYVKRLQERPTPPAEPQAGKVVNPRRPTAEEEPPQMLERTSPPTPVVQLPTPRFWGAFEDLFPVTLHGKPPTKVQAAEAGFEDRSYYHYWRRLQYKLRVQYTLEQSTDRTGQKPPASRVQRAIAKETRWTTNVPSMGSVLLAWVPCQEPSPVANDPLLIASVVHQKWKGLAIKHFEGKGKGVIATMEFQRNQVVCDYHGEVVSKREGERRLETLTGEPSYLFFFKGKGGKPLCIDAQKFPCDCHPDKETFGRRMNHSRRRNNVRRQIVSLNCPNGPRECVLFFALRDIAVNEELLWDYGFHRASFRGEGRGLPWLDD
ncbi:uncharacterized protein LOC107693605 [Sinocyclocheilus anshuiensis]|uniref:uncharacterized protein LOC107693605 n=1 Tax=Sinocyclocheilus anshuiensis TaxID=1608454 RepID=UPI0007B7D302|nr:PREDICTED: uncharacterized protein LOC107693605 [Sinocyclocheilus anshuiensis]XP_016348543.1 PREDICTED: uncharacterized protein LOC107693605 [Sinocyclocheilus anshuiensis]